jgi:hypothetical protein
MGVKQTTVELGFLHQHEIPLLGASRREGTKVVCFKVAMLEQFQMLMDQEPVHQCQSGKEGDNQVDNDGQTEEDLTPDGHVRADPKEKRLFAQFLLHFILLNMSTP